LPPSRESHYNIISYRVFSHIMCDLGERTRRLVRSEMRNESRIQSILLVGDPREAVCPPDGTDWVEPIRDGAVRGAQATEVSTSAVPSPPRLTLRRRPFPLGGNGPRNQLLPRLQYFFCGSQIPCREHRVRGDATHFCGLAEPDDRREANLRCLYVIAFKKPIAR
jgi:hypothetical protein